jgi:hypothetical protein
MWDSLLIFLLNCCGFSGVLHFTWQCCTYPDNQPEINSAITTHELTLEKVASDNIYKNALSMSILQIGEFVAAHHYIDFNIPIIVGFISFNPCIPLGRERSDYLV